MSRLARPEVLDPIDPVAPAGREAYPDLRERRVQDVGAMAGGRHPIPHHNPESLPSAPDLTPPPYTL